MASVLIEIGKWASTLPYWEQAALEKIVNGVMITEQDYDELLRYLLEDAGLTECSRDPRPDLTVVRAKTDDGEIASKPMRLKRLSNLCNVNALVPQQELTFGQALTVIYGANGSGKSGYARVIGSAAFTRGDKQVLVDVTQPAARNTLMTADIDLTDGAETRIIRYEVGKPCPEMQGFYVFDSTSVRAHLTKSNPMSFSPAGLAYLTRLAEVTDEVRRRLQTQVDKRSCGNPVFQLFVGDTEAARMAAGLGVSTSMEAVALLS